MQHRLGCALCRLRSPAKHRRVAEFHLAVRQHALYNVIGSVAPIAITLVTVPVFLSYLGEARYGVLALVWLVTGYLVFFDFGIGKAMAYEVARRADAEDHQREEIFWTAMGIGFGFGGVGSIAMYALSLILFGSSI